jgi:hypothetical protein
MKKEEFYTSEERKILLAAKQIIKSNKRDLLRDIIKDETGYDVIPMSDKLYQLLDELCKQFISQFNQDNSQKTHSKFGWLVEDKFREFCNLIHLKDRDILIVKSQLQYLNYLHL